MTHEPLSSSPPADPNHRVMVDPQVPDGTAVRTALWRALHVEVDAPPHVLEDTLGLQLVAPDPAWRERPDMDPAFTRGFRASMVARARFVEDLIGEQLAAGVSQVVLLGAGLDTLAERRPDLAARIFEVDRGETQAWKRQRLHEIGVGVPEALSFVPVDFEAGESWWEGLGVAGFEFDRPAVVVVDRRDACTSRRTRPRRPCDSSPRSPRVPPSR